jgi:DNA-binding MarR family transcriptional regulator
LKRTRSNTDRRVFDLTLTRKGEAVAAEIPDIALPVLNGRVKSFTKAEFKELLRLLGKFIDADIAR